MSIKMYHQSKRLELRTPERFHQLHTDAKCLLCCRSNKTAMTGYAVNGLFPSHSSSPNCSAHFNHHSGPVPLGGCEQSLAPTPRPTHPITNTHRNRICFRPFIISI